MGKKKVAFICVHNSCRSQIAEALGKHLAADVFESYSAGTETKSQINQDAVRMMKEIYCIDMERNGQYSKLISDIPEVDIAISMGCNVGCPFIGRAFDDNWGLEDPTGKPDEEFRIVISQIEEKIWELRRSISGEKSKDEESYRGNGYSKQLFEKAIACAIELGYKKAVINTIPKVMPVGYKMYLRYGFVENYVDEKGIVNLSMDLV